MIIKLLNYIHRLLSIENQLSKGVFMTGESISIQRTLRNISQIHYDIIEGGLKSFKMMSNQFYEKILGQKTMELEPKIEEILSFGKKVAIIGLGSIFPDARNIPQFWENIINKKNSITEVPNDRWEPDIFFNKDHSIPEKTYTKIGGFVKEFEFKSIKYRIPPKIPTRIN